MNQTALFQEQQAEILTPAQTPVQTLPGAWAERGSQVLLEALPLQEEVRGLAWAA